MSSRLIGINLPKNVHWTFFGFMEVYEGGLLLVGCYFSIVQELELELGGLDWGSGTVLTWSRWGGGGA